MFIQTEPMPDTNRMKFYPGEPVLKSGFREFSDEVEAERSPLAKGLFDITGVNLVTLYDESIMITKDAEADWQILKPMILGAIMDHYATGAEVITELDTDTGLDSDLVAFDVQDRPEDAETIKQIQEIIETRIKPAAEQMGGQVVYKAFKDQTLFVEFSGPTATLASGMENVISHYIPEVKHVKDYRDAIPKPGLDTADAHAIQEILDQRINPAVAGHGGHISLIDVICRSINLSLKIKFDK